MTKGKIHVPTAAMVNGSCDEKNSYMTLSWPEDTDAPRTSNITFHFFNDGHSFYINKILINLLVSDQSYPNATGKYCIVN